MVPKMWVYSWWGAEGRPWMCGLDVRTLRMSVRVKGGKDKRRTAVGRSESIHKNTTSAAQQADTAGALHSRLAGSPEPLRKVEQ